MNLGISNLAFPGGLDGDMCAILSKAGVRGIEVAPTRLGDWSSLTPSRLGAFRTLLNDNGLSIPSLQAILFNVPDAYLLKDKAQFEAMAEHIRRVAGIASSLGAEVLVFGAPKQRARGDLAEDAAFHLGVERLSILARVCRADGVTLAIEPVPAAYGGDFLTSWQDVWRMVRSVSDRHLAVHLDTGCVLLGEGDIGDAIMSTAPGIKHFHVAEPELKGFKTTESDHARAADCLRKVRYAGWLVIEMLGKTDHAFAEALEAVEFVKHRYGDGVTAGVQSAA